MSIEAVKWAMDDAPMLLTDKGKPDTTARGVLHALAEHAHKNGKGAHPSVLRLQYRTGYDRRTVQRALRRLEDGKLIAADGIVGGRTAWRLNLKSVRPASDWADLEAEEESFRASTAERKRRSRAKAVTHSDDVTGADVTHSASGRHARNAALTINQPPVQPPLKKDSSPSAQSDTPADSWDDYAATSPAAALPLDGGWPDPFDTHPAPQQAAAAVAGADEFDAFYAAYPKRVAKETARKAWISALKRGAAADHVIAAAARYADERQGQDPKFTPYPATWLNRGSYDDEPEPTGRHLRAVSGGWQPFRNPENHDVYDEDLI